MNADDLTRREAERVIAMLSADDQEWVRAHHTAQLEYRERAGRRAGRLTDLGAWVVGIGLLLGGVLDGCIQGGAAFKAADYIATEEHLKECRRYVVELRDKASRINSRCLEQVECSCEEGL